MSLRPFPPSNGLHVPELRHSLSYRLPGLHQCRPYQWVLICQLSSVSLSCNQHFKFKKLLGCLWFQNSKVLTCSSVAGFAWLFCPYPSISSHYRTGWSQAHAQMHTTTKKYECTHARADTTCTFTWHTQQVVLHASPATQERRVWFHSCTIFVQDLTFRIHQLHQSNFRSHMNCVYDTWPNAFYCVQSVTFIPAVAATEEQCEHIALHDPFLWKLLLCYIIMESVNSIPAIQFHLHTKVLHVWNPILLL